MSLTRREFVKVCSASVAGFGISRMFHPAVVQAISGSLDGSRPPVLWVKGLACGGCTASLLESSHPSIPEIFLKLISLEFHPDLSVAEGAPALENIFKIAHDYRGRFFMLLEGAIPLAAAGRYALAGQLGGREYSSSELILDLAPRAAAVMAVGTCAAYGGVAAARGAPTGAVGLTDFLLANKIRVPLVNVPGCAPRPEWIVGELASTLDLFARHDGRPGGRGAVGELAASLDSYQRPLALYAELSPEDYADAWPGFPDAVSRVQDKAAS